MKRLRHAGRHVGRSGMWSAVFWFLLQTPLAACPVCFQIEDGQAAAGVRAAVLVLMAVTVLVLGVTGSYLFSTDLWKSVPGVDRAPEQATPGTEQHKSVENRYDPL